MHPVVVAQAAPVAAAPKGCPADGDTMGFGRMRSHNALVAELQFAGETHGNSQRLRVVDLNIEAEGRLQTHREDLHLLRLCVGTRAGKEGL